jgi:hypothetical protein
VCAVELEALDEGLHAQAVLAVHARDAQTGHLPHAITTIIIITTTIIIIIITIIITIVIIVIEGHTNTYGHPCDQPDKPPPPPPPSPSPTLPSAPTSTIFLLSPSKNSMFPNGMPAPF